MYFRFTQASKQAAIGTIVQAKKPPAKNYRSINRLTTQSIPSMQIETIIGGYGGYFETVEYIQEDWIMTKTEDRSVEI
jgi:hypothetical protein